MKTDRAILLNIVAILLGVPGVILLFLEGKSALGAMALVAVMVVIGAATIIHLQASQPAYTLQALTTHLKILGATADRAAMEKRYRLRANHAQLREILFSNIGADGIISNIRWNDQPIPPADIRSVRGNFEVTVRFPLPHGKGQTVEGTLAYDAANAFPGNPEGLWYVPDFPGGTAHLLVDLPPERPSKTASVWKVTGAGRTQMDLNVERSPDGTRLRTTIRRAIPGEQYALFWEW